MLRTHVESSTIEQIGWDNETLYVRFLKSGVYAYAGVPVSVYQDMIAAESAGKFLHHVVKPAYPFVRMSGDPFAGVDMGGADR